ncbi:MAG: hypothetical protein HYV07_31555 [Deltaproteobacteria bacterium]|nr:hypothetical protein [Deltaproteobacteria bacterium]
MSDEPDGSGSPSEDDAPPTASGVRAYSSPLASRAGADTPRAQDPASTAWEEPALSEPDRSVHASHVIVQEGRPPLDHTARVRAERTDAAAPPIVMPVEPRAEASGEPTSSDLARRAQKARRRARDQKAERTALFVVVAVAVVFGVAGWFVLDELERSDKEELANRPDASQGAPKPSRPLVVTTHGSDDDGEIPALTTMREEGLTIAAEGLPRILVEGGASQAANIAAAVLTCRFAYGIWEFSPNAMFKFVPTCAKLRGEESVGAYEIRRGEVWLSAITTSEGTVIETVFKVAKPSSVVSTAKLGDKIQLRVEQRVTVIRPGMNAVAFQRSLGEKNTIDLAALLRDGASAPAPERREAPPPNAPEPPSPPKDRDPVLDLLEGDE